jgi:hypothetical protein
VLKRTSKLVVAATTAIVAIMAFGPAAYAAGTGSVTPSTNLTDGQSVSVSYSGMQANGQAFISECNNDQGTDFDLFADCSFLSLTQGDIDASGNGSKNFTVKKNPTELADGDVDWRCDASGTPTGQLDANNIRVFSTCRIRVTDGDYGTTTNAFFRDISFASAPDPVVPEAPLAVLLPLGAVAVAGAAFFVLRNRKPTLSA